MQTQTQSEKTITITLDAESIWHEYRRWNRHGDVTLEEVHTWLVGRKSEWLASVAADAATVELSVLLSDLIDDE